MRIREQTERLQIRVDPQTREMIKYLSRAWGFTAMRTDSMTVRRCVELAYQAEKAREVPPPETSEIDEPGSIE